MDRELSMEEIRQLLIKAEIEANSEG